MIFKSLGQQNTHYVAGQHELKSRRVRRNKYRKLIPKGEIIFKNLPAWKLRTSQTLSHRS